MPHIRLRGIGEQTIASLNSPLVQKLSEVIGSSVDHFTFEHVQTHFFSDGKVTNGYPFVEVLWFSRSQEVQDACAKVITDSIRKLSPDLDITIIFIELSKSGYYENGSHF